MIEDDPSWIIGKSGRSIRFDARRVRAGGQLSVSPTWQAISVDATDMDDLTRAWWRFRSSVRLFGPSAPVRDKTRDAFRVIDELNENGEISDALRDELRDLISGVAGYEYMEGRADGQSVRK